MKKTIIKNILCLLISMLMMAGTAQAITLWYLDGTTLKPVDPTWTVTGITVGNLFDSIADMATTTNEAAGDLLYATSTDNVKWTNLAIGTNGNILSVVGGLPRWIASSTITTLSGLSITSGQVSDFNNAADVWITGTTTLPKITTLAALSITSANVSDMASYWDNRFNGTTTDALTEGTTNLYMTQTGWSTFMAGTTTDALTEGSTNLYFTTTNADTWFSASTSLKMTYASTTALSMTDHAWFTSTGDSYLYVNAGAEYLLWDDGGDKFFFSDDISTNDDIAAGTLTITTSGTIPYLITTTGSFTTTYATTTDTDTLTVNNLSTLNTLATIPYLISTTANFTTSYATSSYIENIYISGDQITDFQGDGFALSGTTLIFDCSDVASTGLTCSGEDLQLDATGAWTGTIDGNNFSGGAVATGDLLYGAGAGDIAELTISTNGKILSIVNGLPAWIATSTMPFLLDTGDTGTGVYDFGGATSFEIPNGAPTVDAAGEIAIDITSGQLKWFDGTYTHITSGTTTASFNISSTTLDAFGKNINTATSSFLLRNGVPFTMSGFYCKATTTGMAIVRFGDNENWTDEAICTSAGIYTPTKTNNTWNLFEDFVVQASSTAKQVQRITITIFKQLTAD